MIFWDWSGQRFSYEMKIYVMHKHSDHDQLIITTTIIMIIIIIITLIIMIIIIKQ